MQKIIYSPQFIGSTIETSMNNEYSEVIVNTPSTGGQCSLSTAIWYGPIQNLSTDSTCSCPNLTKYSKKISGITYYKCSKED